MAALGATSLKVPLFSVESVVLSSPCGCRLKTKIKFPPLVRPCFGLPRKFGQTHAEVKPALWFAPCSGRFAVLPRVLTFLIMDKNIVLQRILDYDKIKSLCRFYSSDKCPLVFKTCNIENCPLFIILSLKDCDCVFDFLTDYVF